jgi:hypothetical protein
MQTILGHYWHHLPASEGVELLDVDANSESTLAGILVRQAVGTTALHLIKNANRAFFLSQ